MPFNLKKQMKKAETGQRAAARHPKLFAQDTINESNRKLSKYLNNYSK